MYELETILLEEEGAEDTRPPFQYEELQIPKFTDYNKLTDEELEAQLRKNQAMLKRDELKYEQYLKKRNANVKTPG